MKKEKFQKIIEEWTLKMALICIIVAPFIYVVCTNPDKVFWDNSMGNLLATVLALIAGIPIAFMVDRFIQKKQSEDEFEEDRKREYKILTVIKEELEFSYKSLFLSGKKGNTNEIKIQPLKSDMWSALLASEEIKDIEDIDLINRITSAYYVLNLVKDIEHQAYIALRTSATKFTINGQKVNAAQLLLKDARFFDTLFEDSVREALKAINKRIKTLKNN